MGFLAEFQKLRESVPHPCILNLRSENSDYCPYVNDAKNCYLLVGFTGSEDCCYGYWVGNCQDCFDNSFLDRCVLCYECLDLNDCFNCDYCQDLRGCNDCSFCRDCIGCQHCFGCVNLKRKKFCIFNEQFGEKDYFLRLKDFLKKGASENLRNFQEFEVKHPRVYFKGYDNDDSTGDHIDHCKGTCCSFEGHELEDCGYVHNAFKSKDVYDCCFFGWGELNYMCHSAVQDYNCNFCNLCWYSQNLEYCEYVYNSHDCFGCVSLNHAEFCILNKQYSEAEYKKKVVEIKNEMRKSGEYGETFESQYSEYLAWF